MCLEVMFVWQKLLDKSGSTLSLRSRFKQSPTETGAHSATVSTGFLARLLLTLKLTRLPKKIIDKP